MVVFAKNPIPNQVKTRLIPKFSPEAAARLYGAFLADWCETLANLPIEDVDIVVTYTPTAAEANLRTLIGEHAAVYTPQRGEGLGERLTSATTWAVKAGYTQILLVGSDSPTLPISYISQAFTLLETREIVIGPSMDGGYYLIGFSATCVADAVPWVFEGITWSTAAVFQQTVERIDALKAKMGLLPPWYDVDTVADVAFLRAHLSALRLADGEVRAKRTESVLAELL